MNTDPSKSDHISHKESNGIFHEVEIIQTSITILIKVDITNKIKKKQHTTSKFKTFYIKQLE